MLSSELKSSAAVYRSLPAGGAYVLCRGWSRDIIAFILTLIIGKGIRKYAYTDLLGFFFVIFLATWAGGLWIEPAGAGWWGATLAVFVVVGTIVALIMAASLPTSAHRTRHAAPTGGPIDNIHQESFQNVFLLVTILALIAAIVFRFIHAWRQ